MMADDIQRSEGTDALLAREYAEDENTWFLKAECSVDGVKMTCEAKVTGTTEAPEVLAFDVY